MNASLLSALSDALHPQSGLGALLGQASGKQSAAGSKTAFAELLGQQTEAMDAEFAALLADLGIDVEAVDTDTKDALLAQLKQLVQDEAPHHALAAALEPLLQPQQHTQSITAKGKDATASHVNNELVQNTLFVANESKALRAERFSPMPTKATQTAVKFSLNTAATTTNTAGFDTKVELQNVRTTITNTANSTSFSGLSNTEQNTNNHSSGSPANLGLQQASASSLAALNQAGAQSTPSAFTATYSTQITTPVQQQVQWSNEFGRVMVQISQQASATGQTAGLQTAEIRLDPPELGPLRIMLSINEGVANAMIFAAHAQTRQAVELSLPQLQQQLAQSGLSLGEASVSDQGFFAQSDQHAEQKASDNSETFSLDMKQSGLEQNTLTDENIQQNAHPDAIIDTFA